MKEINKRHNTQHTQRAGIAQTETAGHILANARATIARQTSRTPATAGARPHETASLMTVIFESETSKHPTKL